MTTPTDPVRDWDTIRSLPEGAALADAYLTLRAEMNSLIALCQQAERGKGMSVQALREYAEQRDSLLRTPYGVRWTEAYEAARLALLRVRTPLKDHVALVERGKHHKWLVTDALSALDAADQTLRYEDVDGGHEDTQEIERLREALRWYAAEGNWDRGVDREGDPQDSEAQEDEGKRARAALSHKVPQAESVEGEEL